MDDDAGRVDHGGEGAARQLDQATRHIRGQCGAFGRRRAGLDAGTRIGQSRPRRIDRKVAAILGDGLAQRLLRQQTIHARQRAPPVALGRYGFGFGHRCHLTRKKKPGLSIENLVA